jgi:hypothetical protein
VSDLRVESADLEAVAAQLGELSHSADETATRVRALKAEWGAAGHPVLVDAGTHFFDKWKYGLECIRNDGRSLSKMLHTAVAGFASVDDQLGAAGPRVDRSGPA